MVAELLQLWPVTLIKKRSEVFGPENNGVHPINRCRDDGNTLVKGIDDLKKALVDLLHKPGHVEGRDIGSSGSRDNNFLGRTHFGCISGLRKRVSITENNNEWILIL